MGFGHFGWGETDLPSINGPGRPLRPLERWRCGDVQCRVGWGRVEGVELGQGLRTMVAPVPSLCPSSHQSHFTQRETQT